MQTWFHVQLDQKILKILVLFSPRSHGLKSSSYIYSLLISYYQKCQRPTRREGRGQITPNTLLLAPQTGGGTHAVSAPGLQWAVFIIY